MQFLDCVRGGGGGGEYFHTQIHYEWMHSIIHAVEKFMQLLKLDNQLAHRAAAHLHLLTVNASVNSSGSLKKNDWRPPTGFHPDILLLQLVHPPLTPANTMSCISIHEEVTHMEVHTIYCTATAHYKYAPAHQLARELFMFSCVCVGSTCSANSLKICMVRGIGETGCRCECECQLLSVCIIEYIWRL